MFGWSVPVVLAVTFVAYIPSLRNGFINWDDNYYVTENALVAHPTWNGLLTTNVAGNPWPICTLWLAFWKIATASTPADLERARGLIELVAERALPSGVLAEQFDPYTGAPLSVSPLTWSHATFVETALAYGEKARGLRGI